MIEVVRAHGDESCAVMLEKTMRDLQALAWLEDGITTEIDLGHDAFGVMTLESALDEFCTILGQKVHDHWGSGEAAPMLPMDVKGVVEKLRNSTKKNGDGKNPLEVRRHPLFQPYPTIHTIRLRAIVT